jgi:hypothetical protein
MIELRQRRMQKEGFDLDEDAKEENKKGLREHLADFNYYKQELQNKYDYKTEDELKRMMFSYDMDLEDDPQRILADIIPNHEMVEKVYVIMPPAADFSDLSEDFNRKVNKISGLDDKVYKFNDSSVDMKIRKIVEK